MNFDGSRCALSATPVSSSFTNSSVDYQHWSARNTLRSSFFNRDTDLARVLVLYVGGTMGMRYDPDHGYVSERGLLREILLSHPYFHCSDSRHVNQQGSSAPGHPADGALGGGDRSLVLPTSIYSKSVVYSILEYAELLDSSNMKMEHWTQIAQDVSSNYAQYDGFVVVHGTDTMAYTSSALSFMLEGLGKPVVLTGSQIPFSEGRNDAGDNLLGALTIAGHFMIPEVMVYFSHKLYRGNRVIKASAVDLDAFESPNMKPLGSVGVGINLEWGLVLEPRGGDRAPFRLMPRMEPNVAVVRMFPGMTAEALRAFLAPPIRGVILETFGTGNIPTNRPDLLETLREALQERDVVVVNVSQCRRGSVDPGLYATGRPLFALGAIPGYDMTVECALAKLGFLLGNYGEDLGLVRRLMEEDLRGELTKNRHPHTLHFAKK